MLQQVSKWYEYVQHTKSSLKGNSVGFSRSHRASVERDVLFPLPKVTRGPEL